MFPAGARQVYGISHCVIFTQTKHCNLITWQRVVLVSVIGDFDKSRQVFLDTWIRLVYPSGIEPEENIFYEERKESDREQPIR